MLLLSQTSFYCVCLKGPFNHHERQQPHYRCVRSDVDTDVDRHLTSFGLRHTIQVLRPSYWWGGGTAAAAPPPFRPGNPALCGSCPLVTPYYCRLGDLLCYTCMRYFSTILCVYACVGLFCVFFVLCVVFLYSFLLQYCDTVGWVF